MGINKMACLQLTKFLSNLIHIFTTISLLIIIEFYQWHV